MSDDPKWTGETVTTSRYHLREQQIPEGFQIFKDRIEVAGISFRKRDAASFASSKGGWLEFERDQENEHDRNAIKVIGCTKGLLGTKRRFVGHVPKEIAKLIVERGFWGKIQPRLLKTDVSANGFVEILFQILGPEGQKYNFDPPESREDRHYTEYVERVKQLKAENRNSEAMDLLLKLVNETEQEAKAAGWGVAPWYYEQLAVLYRKEKRYDDEVRILERYESRSRAPGVGSEQLAKRLTKARQLRDAQPRSKGDG